MISQNFYLQSVTLKATMVCVWKDMRLESEPEVCDLYTNEL